MKTDYEFIVLVIAIALTISSATIAISVKDYYLHKNAMEQGYEQVLERSTPLWKKISPQTRQTEV